MSEASDCESETFETERATARVGGDKTDVLSFEPRAERPMAPSVIELSALWPELVAGRVVVTNVLASDGRSFLELEDRGHPQPIAGENGRILARVLEGERPKELAAELGLSVSTLSTRYTSVLVAMGLEASILRAPVILAMAAFAVRCLALGQAPVECRPGYQRRWWIGVQNPIASLRAQLSPSEYEVAGLAIDGKTHSELAALRGTSERTVANQLASSFRKAGVSGRADLRAKAIVEYALQAQKPPSPKQGRVESALRSLVA